MLGRFTRTGTHTPTHIHTVMAPHIIIPATFIRTDIGAGITGIGAAAIAGMPAVTAAMSAVIAAERWFVAEALSVEVLSVEVAVRAAGAGNRWN